ncbi:MAG: hypothetical protein ABR557_03250 [Pyrinomonadaceae bacterium]
MIFEIQRDKKGFPKPVQTSSLAEEGWIEKDLEDYLRDNLPKLISDDLMVIRQSKPYQPEADLLALDRQGDLWIFELKKVATSSDNLLQVMRYSQNAANFSVDDLSHLYLADKAGKSDSLVVAFCNHFGFVSPTAAQQWGDNLGRNHHLVVIADGTDEEAIQAVSHWQKSGVDIQLWPYRIHAGDKSAFRFELPDLFIKGRQISRGAPGIFLVNTARKNRSSSALEEHMLTHECALATGEPWLFKINRVLTGSRVLLYANRAGIIAVGIATAEKRNIDLEGEPGRIVRLRDFRKLKVPLPAASIRAIAGENYPLLQTLRKLPDEIGGEIWEKCLALT